MTRKEYSKILEELLSKTACNYLDTPEGERDIQEAQRKIVEQYFKNKYNV